MDTWLKPTENKKRDAEEQKRYEWKRRGNKKRRKMKSWKKRGKEISGIGEGGHIRIGENDNTSRALKYLW